VEIDIIKKAKELFGYRYFEALSYSALLVALLTTRKVFPTFDEVYHEVVQMYEVSKRRALSKEEFYAYLRKMAKL